MFLGRGREGKDGLVSILSNAEKVLVSGRGDYNGK